MMIENKTKAPLALYFLLAAYYIFAIIYMRPGLFLGDSAFQHYEYRVGNYTDWQPPMMNIWWSVFHTISAPFVAHLTIFSLGVYLFITALSKDRQLFRVILLFIILMNPLVSFSMLNLLKDNAMTASLIFISSILYKYYKGQMRFIWVASLLIPFFIYAFGVRQNAIFAIYPLLVFLFLKTERNFLSIVKSCVYSIFACIVLLFINYVVTYKIYPASKDHAEVIAMKYDLSAIECLTNHRYKIPNSVFAQPEQEAENRTKLCQDLSVKQSDSLFWWTPENRTPPFKGGASVEQYQTIKAEWIKTIPRHFPSYLKFRFQVFGYSLMHNNWYLGPAVNKDYNFEISIARPYIYNAVNRIYIASYHMIKHGFGLFVLILNAILLMTSFLKAPRNAFKICLLLSGLFYEIMWFFILPVPDARYFLWFYVATFIAVVLPSKTLRPKNHKHS